VPVVVLTPASPLWRRLSVQVVGIALVATGVALTIQAELGVAPYDVVTTGLHELFDIPIGVAAVLLPLLFVAIGALLGARLGAGTALDVLLVGPVLGLVLDHLPEVDALAPRMGLYAVGFVVLTVGIVLVIVPELGAGPAELVMLAVADKGYPLAPARTVIELVCVAVGFAIGGQVGVGTLAFALLIGPALRRTLTFVGYDADLAGTRSDTASPGA
jgi:uncharacterized membrane protein YczE